MSTMRVVSGDRVLGTVTTMRDRTALADLEQEIGSFRSTAHVLRAQAHEFANQLHTISGLIQIGELDEVVRYVDALSERRDALDLTVNTLVRDPTIAALLMAKVATANERRVELTISDETMLERLEPGDAADVATVLGNLVDNALEHAPRGTASAPVGPGADPAGREHASRSSSSDSGPGIPDDLVRTVFEHGVTTKRVDPMEHGVGPRPHPARLPPARRRDPRRARGRRDLVRRPPRRHEPHRTRCRGVVLVIRVLVVDDDFMVARIHVGFVERVDGFEVVGVAHSGAEAADAVADASPRPPPPRPLPPRPVRPRPARRPAHAARTRATPSSSPRPRRATPCGRPCGSGSPTTCSSPSGSPTSRSACSGTPPSAGCSTAPRCTARTTSTGCSCGRPVPPAAPSPCPRA